MSIRLDKNGSPYECKTDRVRGHITEQVMAVARRGRPFTRKTVSPDQSDQIRNRLWALKRKGILKIIRRGINGPHGQPTVYQINRER